MAMADFNDELDYLAQNQHRVVYDRENWWGTDRETGLPKLLEISRLRIQNGGLYDVSDWRYIRVDKFACTAEGSERPDGPWVLCPLIEDEPH